MCAERRVKVNDVEVSMTEQCHKEACDINNIIKKYRATGLMPQVVSPGYYGDFTRVEDYQTSVNRVLDAQYNFSCLPASVRERFKNDVGELIDFVSDEKNRAEAVKLGLVPEKSIVAPASPVVAAVSESVKVGGDSAVKS